MSSDSFDTIGGSPEAQDPFDEVSSLPQKRNVATNPNQNSRKRRRQSRDSISGSDSLQSSDSDENNGDGSGVSTSRNIPAKSDAVADNVGQSDKLGPASDETKQKFPDRYSLRKFKVERINLSETLDQLFVSGNNYKNIVKRMTAHQEQQENMSSMDDFQRQLISDDRVFHVEDTVLYSNAGKRPMKWPVSETGAQRQFLAGDTEWERLYGDFISPSDFSKTHLAQVLPNDIANYEPIMHSEPSLDKSSFHRKDIQRDWVLRCWQRAVQAEASKISIDVKQSANTSSSEKTLNEAGDAEERNNTVNVSSPVQDNSGTPTDKGETTLMPLADKDESASKIDTNHEPQDVELADNTKKSKHSSSPSSSSSSPSSSSVPSSSEPSSTSSSSVTSSSASSSSTSSQETLVSIATAEENNADSKPNANDTVVALAQPASVQTGKSNDTNNNNDDDDATSTSELAELPSLGVDLCERLQIVPDVTSTTCLYCGLHCDSESSFIRHFYGTEKCSGCCWNAIRDKKLELTRNVLNNEVKNACKQIVTFVINDVHRKISESASDSDNDSQPENSRNGSSLFDWQYVLELFDKQIEEPVDDESHANIDRITDTIRLSSDSCSLPINRMVMESVRRQIINRYCKLPK